jgi:hypothetical protein
MRSNLIRLGMVGALAVSLLGCDEATGARAGEVEVGLQAVGDGEAGGASTSESVSEDAASNGEGQIRFRVRVYARAEGGEWIELTRRGAEEARVQASGRAHAVAMSSAWMREGRYDRVRVEFEEVEATDVRVQLNLGTLLTGSLGVRREGGSAGRVEEPIGWTVRDGGAHRLLIDLNSSAWMRRADPQSRAVARADFESAVRVRAE